MVKIKLQDGIYRTIFDESLERVLKDKKICCGDVDCCQDEYTYCKGCIFDCCDIDEYATIEELSLIVYKRGVYDLFNPDMDGDEL